MKFKCPVKNSWPLAILRLEAFIAVLLGLYLFQYFGGSWILFACLFLVPELSLFGYLRGPKIGALTYNLFHTTVGPIILAGISFSANIPILLLIGFIWGINTYFFRLLGVGLKSSKGFKESHMGGFPFKKSEKKQD